MMSSTSYALKVKTRGVKFGKTKHHTKEDNRLPSVFNEELKPVFTRLTNDDLLKRCLQEQTQN